MSSSTAPSYSRKRKSTQLLCVCGKNVVPTKHMHIVWDEFYTRRFEQEKSHIIAHSLEQVFTLLSNLKIQQRVHAGERKRISAERVFHSRRLSESTSTFTLEGSHITSHSVGSILIDIVILKDIGAFTRERSRIIVQCGKSLAHRTCFKTQQHIWP